MDLKTNRDVIDYINDVCSKVKYQEMHEEIKAELENHIEELVEEYLAKTISEDEAIQKAIKQMGESAIVGKRLNEIHKPKLEWSILALTVVFSVFGMITVYFIESTGALRYSPSSMFANSFVFTILGLAIAFGLYFFDYRAIKPFPKYIYLGTILVLVFITFTDNYGAVSLKRNFVHAAPVILTIALAGILDKWNWNNSKTICLGLGMLVLPIPMLASYPALTSAVIYTAASIVLMIATGIKLKYVLTLAASGLGIFYISVIDSPYMINRILGFINYSSDPLGYGYINAQLKNHIHSSGLLGQGFTFDPTVIPEAHTDFILGYIIYTFGLLAGAIIIGLVTGFIFRLANVTKEVKNSFGKLLVTGITVIFSVQFLWNILMILGLAPIVGVQLPFISYGNTQFIINMIMIGLVLSIYGRKNVPCHSALHSPDVYNILKKIEQGESK